MSSSRCFPVNTFHSETGTQRSCPVRTSCCRNSFVVDIETFPHTPQLIYRVFFIFQVIWLATASECSEIPCRPQSWSGCSHRSFGDGRFQIQNIVLGFKPDVVEDRQNRSAADDIADLLQMCQQCFFSNGAFHFMASFHCFLRSTTLFEHKNRATAVRMDGGKSEGRTKRI